MGTHSRKLTSTDSMQPRVRALEAVEYLSIIPCQCRTRMTLLASVVKIVSYYWLIRDKDHLTNTQ